MLGAEGVVAGQVDAAASLAPEEDGAAEDGAALVGRVRAEGVGASEGLDEAELGTVSFFLALFFFPILLHPPFSPSPETPGAWTRESCQRPRARRQWPGRPAPSGRQGAQQPCSRLDR